ncbi:MAG: PD-(D/E)XK nuclease family protein, partial [Thermoanaerobaculia bacterium]
IVDIHGVPLKVEGTIDRIDRADGRMRIVDYKSGEALRHVELSEKIDRGVRLQLALYAMAAAEFFRIDASDVSGAIKPLVIADSDPDRFSFQLGEKKTLLLETLEIFVGAIRRGEFPAFPNEGEKQKDFNSCKYCPVNHSCRTKHDPEERRAILAAAGEPRSLLRPALSEVEGPVE